MSKSHQQLWLASLAATASTLGSAVFGFGLSLYLLAKTGSNISFALSVVIQPLVGLALMPVVGPFVDRHSKKAVILWSQLASIIALIGFALTFTQTTHLFALSIMLLIALRASDQFTSTAQQASKINLVEAEQLQALTGYQQVGQSLSGIFASMLGAALYAMLPFVWLIIAEVICEAIALIATWGLNFHFAQNQTLSSESQPHWQQFKSGFTYLSHQKALFAFITIAVGLNLLGTIDAVGLPVMLLKTMHWPAWRYALGDTAFGIGTLLASLQLSRRPPLTHPLQVAWRFSMMFGGWLAGLGLVGVLHAHTTVATIILVITQALLGWNQNWLNIPFSVWVQTTVPQDLQGRVFNLISTMVMAAMPLGVGLYTLVFSVTAISAFWWQPFVFAMAGLVVVGFSFLSIRLRHLDLSNP
ncbi:MFS transporter [Lacticaseibacillus porcinae]|uniref:MFS transporter n=1 Tax=Lacticaseibacillus porcinae TaxID=1123687 RepID=UPI000F7823DE|nr:MFS transporter [Lacticaseibacillus porcinae]